MPICVLRPSDESKRVVNVVQLTLLFSLEAWKTSLPVTRSSYFVVLFPTAPPPLVTVCLLPLTRLPFNTSEILSQAPASALMVRRRKKRYSNPANCLGKKSLLRRGLPRGRNNAPFFPHRRTRLGVSMSCFPATPSFVARGTRLGTVSGIHTCKTANPMT